MPTNLQATAGTPRPWTFWCRGRSPGSQVIACFGLPNACASVTSIETGSLLTVAGAAPELLLWLQRTDFPS